MILGMLGTGEIFFILLAMALPIAMLIALIVLVFWLVRRFSPVAQRSPSAAIAPNSDPRHSMCPKCGHVVSNNEPA